MFVCLCVWNENHDETPHGVIFFWSQSAYMPTMQHRDDGVRAYWRTAWHLSMLNFRAKCIFYAINVVGVYERARPRICECSNSRAFHVTHIFFVLPRFLDAQMCATFACFTLILDIDIKAEL